MALIDRGRVMLDYLENVGRQDSYKAKFEALCKAVDEAPTLDYAPVRHGEWITVYPFEDNPQTTLKCSECHTCQPIYEHDEWTFCPFCGAKMDGGKKDV